MADAAQNVARFQSYPGTLPESRTPKKKYVPPVDTQAVKLSDALVGTDRFPKLGHSDLLEGKVRPDPSADMTIFVAGDRSLLERPCVAIVGTRQVSECGFKRAQQLARGLAQAGVVVVSGLAKGIDAAAHSAAIEAGGQTIGVIGTPLDKATPAENAKLQEQIYRNHLLISREPIGATTFRSNFPKRNKLMAVLTDATVVIEASDTSGTLHQSAECTKLGRWLFIAKSVTDDKSLTWPKKFLKYDTCVVLENVSDVTDRLLKPPHGSDTGDPGR